MSASEPETASPPPDSRAIDRALERRLRRRAAVAILAAALATAVVTRIESPWPAGSHVPPVAGGSAREIPVSAPARLFAAKRAANRGGTSTPVAYVEPATDDTSSTAIAPAASEPQTFTPPAEATEIPPPQTERLPDVERQPVGEPAEPVRGGAAPHVDRHVVPAAASAPEEVLVPAAVDVASVFPMIEVTPIDLATALQMVDVRNPEFLLAQTRVLEAIALRQLAAAQFLPNINAGTSYDGHTGNLQQSSGNILSVKRNSLTVGAGVYAVAAGTVNIPGLLWNQNPSAVLFGYLTSRQGVAQSEFAAQARRNDVGLRVVQAYLDLLEAEGRRSIYLLSFREADELARITAAYAQTGQGRPADANRAATERLDRQGFVVTMEGAALMASAQLAQLLGLDPSLRLHPTDNWVVPHTLVPEPIPLNELLTIALLQRPELRERQAATRQALLGLNGQRLLPFSPQVYLGMSADEFGGGSNLVAQPVGDGAFGRGDPRFGSFMSRTDFDAMAYWTLRNIGLGNRALINAAASRLRSADWQRLAEVEQVRMEVANAYVRARARLAQMQTSEEAVAAAHDSWTEDLIRIRGNEGLPIEAVNSLRIYAQSRLAYLTAILEYNRAQFQLYVALGQPPADALVRELPPGAAPLPPPPVADDPDDEQPEARR